MPGVYQLNNLIVTDGENRDEVITNINDNEDIYIEIVEKNSIDEVLVKKTNIINDDEIDQFEEIGGKAQDNFKKPKDILDLEVDEDDLNTNDPSYSNGSALNTYAEEMTEDGQFEEQENFEIYEEDLLEKASKAMKKHDGDEELEEPDYGAEIKIQIDGDDQSDEFEKEEQYDGMTNSKLNEDFNRDLLKLPAHQSLLETFKDNSSRTIDSNHLIIDNDVHIKPKASKFKQDHVSDLLDGNLLADEVDDGNFCTVNNYAIEDSDFFGENPKAINTPDTDFFGENSKAINTPDTDLLGGFVAEPDTDLLGCAVCDNQEADLLGGVFLNNDIPKKPKSPSPEKVSKVMTPGLILHDSEDLLKITKTTSNQSDKREVSTNLLDMIPNSDDFGIKENEDKEINRDVIYNDLLGGCDYNQADLLDGNGDDLLVGNIGQISPKRNLDELDILGGGEDHGNMDLLGINTGLSGVKPLQETIKDFLEDDLIGCGEGKESGGDKKEDLCNDVDLI